MSDRDYGAPDHPGSQHKSHYGVIRGDSADEQRGNAEAAYGDYPFEPHNADERPQWWTPEVEQHALQALEGLFPGLSLFMKNRHEHHLEHDRETCFRETIDELQRQKTAEDTATRRCSGD